MKKITLIYTLGPGLVWCKYWPKRRESLKSYLRAAQGIPRADPPPASCCPFPKPSLSYPTPESPLFCAWHLFNLFLPLALLHAPPGGTPAPRTGGSWRPQLHAPALGCSAPGRIQEGSPPIGGTQEVRVPLWDKAFLLGWRWGHKNPYLELLYSDGFT